MSSKKIGRHCTRSGCHRKAVMTLTYVYADSIAVVGPVATYSEPHAYDLCELHGAKLTFPNGWQVIRREINPADNGPSDEDLMAIADAVREVGLRQGSEVISTNATSRSEEHTSELQSH